MRPCLAVAALEYLALAGTCITSAHRSLPLSTRIPSRA
jgi:hypothetical protein